MENKAQVPLSSEGDVGGDAGAGEIGRADPRPKAVPHLPCQETLPSSRPDSLPEAKPCTPGAPATVHSPSPVHIAPATPNDAHLEQNRAWATSPGIFPPPPPATPAAADARAATWQHQSKATERRKDTPLLLGVTGAKLEDCLVQREPEAEGWWGGQLPIPKPPRVSRKLREKSYLLFCVGAPDSCPQRTVTRPPSSRLVGPTSQHEQLHDARDATGTAPGGRCYADAAPRQSRMPQLRTPDGISQRATALAERGGDPPSAHSLLTQMRRKRLASHDLADNRVQAPLQCVPDLEKARKEEEDAKRQEPQNWGEEMHGPLAATRHGVKWSTQGDSKRLKDEARGNPPTPAVMGPPSHCAPIKVLPPTGGRVPCLWNGITAQRASIAATEMESGTPHAAPAPRSQLPTSGTPLGHNLAGRPRKGAAVTGDVPRRERAFWRAAEEKAMLEHENSALEAKVARLESTLRKSQELIQRLEVRMLLQRGRELSLEEKVQQLEKERDNLKRSLALAEEEGKRAV